MSEAVINPVHFTGPDNDARPRSGQAAGSLAFSEREISLARYLLNPCDSAPKWDPASEPLQRTDFSVEFPFRKEARSAPIGTPSPHQVYALFQGVAPGSRGSHFGVDSQGRRAIEVFVAVHVLNQMQELGRPISVRIK